MENNLKRALQRAACAVLEELTFMLPSRDLDEAQRRAPFHMACVVKFSGPVSGSLVLAIYGDLLPTIASNMLGDLDTPSEFQQMDALKELTNVICGNTLPYLIGEAAVYSICAPSIIEEGAAPAAEREVFSEQLEIGMDQGRANLRLCLCGESQPLEPHT